MAQANQAELLVLTIADEDDASLAELIRSEGADLVVLGSRGGGPVRRAMHGSVSNAVLREASCPVLISPIGVKAPKAALV